MMYTYGEREDGDYLILDNNIPMSADEVVARLRQLETENETLMTQCKIFERKWAEARK